MCVIQKSKFVFRRCKSQNENHYLVKSRVITREIVGISQDVIDKLVCDSPKSTGPYCTDPVYEERGLY